MASRSSSDDAEKALQQFMAVSRTMYLHFAQATLSDVRKTLPPPWRMPQHMPPPPKRMPQHNPPPPKRMPQHMPPPPKHPAPSASSPAASSPGIYAANSPGGSPAGKAGPGVKEEPGVKAECESEDDGGFAYDWEEEEEIVLDPKLAQNGYTVHDIVELRAEEKAAAERGLSWQERGPPGPEDGGPRRWRGQRYRPCSGKWANRGGWRTKAKAVGKGWKRFYDEKYGGKDAKRRGTRGDGGFWPGPAGGPYRGTQS